MITVSKSTPLSWLVTQAIQNKLLAPEIAQGINLKVTWLDPISLGGIEVDELLMSEMDADQIHLIPSPQENTSNSHRIMINREQNHEFMSKTIDAQLEN